MITRFGIDCLIGDWYGTAAHISIFPCVVSQWHLWIRVCTSWEVRINGAFAWFDVGWLKCARNWLAKVFYISRPESLTSTNTHSLLYNFSHTRRQAQHYDSFVGNLRLSVWTDISSIANLLLQLIPIDWLVN